MTSSHGSPSTRNSTAKSTRRSRTRTRTATRTSRTASLTFGTITSESSSVTPAQTSSHLAAVSTDHANPPQNSGSQLTVGLAVGIAFLALAILSIILLFCLRRRRRGQQQPAPSHQIPFGPLHEPNPDEKRLPKNVRHSGYSTTSTRLYTVDEEREDELSVSDSQAKRNWSKMVSSTLGRFTSLLQVPDEHTGAKNDKPQHMSERQVQPRPPPVSRVRLERQPRKVGPRSGTVLDSRI
ncbi:unnamed protein product [Rhizoctonia solani]|uniref:Mid2 domain-containing protein n=1 Tax=Rhizoctonia solani TaxID=456999 RepID=A0A8H2XZ09_9AGAM|nr:unnamed protein product [Rhizoctonia solani]